MSSFNGDHPCAWQLITTRSMHEDERNCKNMKHQSDEVILILSLRSSNLIVTYHEMKFYYYNIPHCWYTWGSVKSKEVPIQNRPACVNELNWSKANQLNENPNWLPKWFVNVNFMENGSGKKYLSNLQSVVILFIYLNDNLESSMVKIRFSNNENLKGFFWLDGLSRRSFCT